MVAFVRPETDIFRIAEMGYVQAVCNPVSTTALETGGLYHVFREKSPGSHAQYFKACINETLHMGDVLAYKDDSCPYYVLTLPTRISAYDQPTAEMITIATCALAEQISLLGVDVAVPMIGCGKNYEYADMALPIMMEILDPLATTVHICVRPSYFKNDPVLLGVMLPTASLTDITKVCNTLKIRRPDLILTTELVPNAVQIGRASVDSAADVPICALPIDINRYGSAESAMLRQYEIIADAATHIVIENDLRLITHKPTIRIPSNT